MRVMCVCEYVCCVCVSMCVVCVCVCMHGREGIDYHSSCAGDISTHHEGWNEAV